MEGGKKPIEIKLVAEGTYGCIYRPGITCDGKQETQQYITKIQKHKRAIQNESDISNKIRTIPGYTRFFAPILKQCGVKLTKDTQRGLKQCEVFKDDNAADVAEYVSTKIRYVGDQDLMKYLLSLDHGFLEKTMKTHLYLLKGVQKMVARKVVHYDIKYNNVIYDQKLDVPIFIDFGLAFTTDKLLDPKADLEKIFFVFEYYSWWPIDVLMCSFAMREIGKMESMTEKVKLEQLDEIYDVFLHGTRDPHDESVRQLKNDIFKIRISNTEEDIATFRTAYYDYFSKFVGQTWWELYEDMIRYTSTWDSYSLAATYLVILDEAGAHNGEKYNSYMNFLKSVVYTSPDKRTGLNATVKQLQKIIPLG